MQITPNDVGSNSDSIKALDLKVAQLIASLSEKPLQLNKINISQSNGLLLTLISQNSKIELQLPLNVTQQLQPLIGKNGQSVLPSVVLSITANKQVQLALVPETTISRASKAIAVLLFAKSTVLNELLLKLENPRVLIQQPQQAQKTDMPPTVVATGTSSPINAPAIGIRQNPLPISAPQQGPSNALGGKPISINISNQNQTTGIKFDTHVTNNSDLNVSAAVKALLKYSFTQPKPLAPHISQIVNQTTHLRKLMSATLRQPNQTPANSAAIEKTVYPHIEKLVSQIQKLLANIQRPNSQQSTNLAQRIANSGNLLESRLGQVNAQQQTQVQHSEGTKQLNIPSPTTPVITKQQGQVSSASNIGHQFNGDLKLTLIQIKAGLEQLLIQLNGRQSSTNQTPINPSPNQPSSSMFYNPQTTQTEANLKNQVISQPILKMPNQQELGNLQRGRNFSIPLAQLNQMQRQVNEILTEVRSSLSQIESNQLLSLRSEQPNLHQFLVDLPFANGSKIDSFELLFEHACDNKSNQAKKQWKVVVRFDLAPLGPMFAQVELKDDKISSHIFAESQTTAKLINEHLHVLKKSLTDAGVDTDAINGSQGNIPDSLIINDEHSVDFHA